MALVGSALRPPLVVQGCHVGVRRIKYTASPLGNKRAFSVRRPVLNQRPVSAHSSGRASESTAGGHVSSPIVVLGGGIAGLTTTLQLARSMPSTRQIVLLEKRNVLGGWIQSDRVQLPSGKGTALIEGGPRSLRPKGVAGWRMLELVRGTSVAHVSQ